MRLLAPYFVTGEGFLYTMIILGGGGFLPPSSHVAGVGMVNDEIDSPIHDGFISCHDRFAECVYTMLLYLEDGMKNEGLASCCSKTNGGIEFAI